MIEDTISIASPEDAFHWEKALCFFPEPYKLHLKKRSPYLYEFECSAFDYEYGKAYWRKHRVMKTPEPEEPEDPTEGIEDDGTCGFCTAYREGDLTFHNYDAPYNERVSFIMHSPHQPGRIPSICMTVGNEDLSKDFIPTQVYNSEYRALPFCAKDGINAFGFSCAINGVPKGEVRTTGTNEGKEELCIMMAVRYLLDCAHNVDEAIALLKTRDIYAPTGNGLDMEAQLFVSDPIRSAVISFVDNEMVVLDNQMGMTNFIPPDGEGGGKERYAILQGDGTFEEKRVGTYYTNSYANGWDGAVPSGGTRDGSTKQTMHSSVYNLGTKEMSVYVQEENTKYPVEWIPEHHHHHDHWHPRWNDRWFLFEDKHHHHHHPHRERGTLYTITFSGMTFPEHKDAILHFVRDAFIRGDTRVIDIVHHNLTIQKDVMCVRELVRPRKFSRMKVLFALDEAAAHILNYTNRHELPKELKWMQCRIAADILLYLTPDLKDGRDPYEGIQNLELDDIKIEGQDDDHTYALSLAMQNPNMEALKNYYAQLQMWRVVPRYRRPPENDFHCRNIDAHSPCETHHHAAHWGVDECFGRDGYAGGGRHGWH